MTEYHPYVVNLTKGQIMKIVKAVVNDFGLSLRSKKNQLSDGEGRDRLMLTKTQINKLQKANKVNEGVDIKIWRENV